MLVPYLATRFVFLATGILAVSLLPAVQSPNAWEGTPYVWLNIWSRWDARLYQEIALNGYTQSYLFAFSPLYPFLMLVGARVIGQVNPTGVLFSGLLISNVSLVVALTYLVMLVRRELNATIARRAALYTLVFPTSFFLSAVYPEALFLALAIGSTYHARQGSWWLSGALAAAAALTRPFGVLVAAPLAFEYVRRQQSLVRAGPEMIALGLAPAAAGAWAFASSIVASEPVPYLSAVATWDARLQGPFDAVVRVIRQPQFNGPENSVIALCAAALFVVLVLLSWKLVPFSLALYGSLLLAIVLAAGTLVSTPRWILALFPGFIVLASLGEKRAFAVIYTASSLLLGVLLMAMFAMWLWVA